MINKELNMQIRNNSFRQNDVGASLNGEVLNRQTYKTQDFIS